jgi:RNA polymerase sigma-70 factor (family 1)
MSQRGKNIEQEWTVRLKNGDEEAFVQVFHAYHAHLHRIAHYYLRDPELANDALQDIFLKLWVNRQQLDETQSIKAFLSLSTRNAVLNLIRDNKRQIVQYIQYTQDWAETDATAEEALSLDGYDTTIRAGVAQLPVQRRRVFELRILEGFTNEQVARHMNISIHTVKAQYAQATKFLRLYLRDHATDLPLMVLLVFAIV